MTEKRTLRPPDIAKRLGVSRQYAAKLIRTIPGAHLAHYTPKMREVWVVEEQAFELWKAGYRLPVLTPRTEMRK